MILLISCFVSQRYWKMKAIHNRLKVQEIGLLVVLYPKDTEKWKQFTTVNNTTYIIEWLFCIPKILKNESNSQQHNVVWSWCFWLFCIPKILKNESNSQQWSNRSPSSSSCFVSQRYWKMKAIHNYLKKYYFHRNVVLYPKDTEKWKQFTT